MFNHTEVLTMALDLTEGSGGKPSENFGRKAYVISRVVDCSEVTVPVDGTVNVIDVPENCYLSMVRTNVLTAEGSALDIDVGDGSDADGFGDALDGNDTDVDSMDTDSAGMYASGGTISVVFKDNGTDDANQPDTCKILVQALVYDFNFNDL